MFDRTETTKYEASKQTYNIGRINVHRVGRQKGGWLSWVDIHNRLPRVEQQGCSVPAASKSGYGHGCKRSARGSKGKRCIWLDATVSPRNPTDIFKLGNPNFLNRRMSPNAQSFGIILLADKPRVSETANYCHGRFEEFTS